MTMLIGSKIRQVCPDNNLSYERFKEILLALEQYGLPQLRDTPTGYRLYELVPKTGQIIRVDQVMEFIDNLVKNSNESQLKGKQWSDQVSFEIMDKSKAGVINSLTFQTFAFDCWQAAFRNLASMIQNSDKANEVPPNSIESWSNSKRSEFANAMHKEFLVYDSDKRGVV